MCLLAKTFWLFELVTHFMPFAAVSAILFTLIFFYQKKYIAALWMEMIAILFFIHVYTAFSPVQTNAGTEIGTLKFLQFNVLYKNNDLPKSIPWIIEQNADVVVLQEINQARANELGELKKHYGWWKIMLNERRDAFGMAIFTNQPVTGFDYVRTDDGWNHYSLTKLLINNQPLHLYEIHTFPPVSPYFSQSRNNDLMRVTDAIAKDEAKHKILIGDLNCTIFSPYLMKLEKETKLHHAQRNFNLEGTWPNFLPAALRLSIDHLLASENIAVQKRTVEAYHGSDHLPVITELAIYE
jgi:endonuclease/exonuclease/phosphatase (EEP) superfamily protein YafD